MPAPAVACMYAAMVGSDRVVCVCSGATAKEICEAIRTGSGTIEELSARLNGTGGVCEICRELIEELLRECDGVGPVAGPPATS